MLVSSIGRFETVKVFNSTFSGDKNSNTLSECRKPCFDIKSNTLVSKNASLNEEAENNQAGNKLSRLA